ncbi:MAG TPA: hypothetical protein PK228_13045 [Saprospiraceae bacterium]|nr:hypothetical protein [Saprospiraceae bacterium]
MNDLSIDLFYKASHLLMTLLVALFLLYIWNKYRLKESGIDRQSSKSLLFFAIALLMWEYNLFDTDYKYEVYTTIIVNSFLLAGVTVFNNGLLFERQERLRRMSKSIPLTAVITIAGSHFLMVFFPDNTLAGYALAILHTLFTLAVITIRLFVYFRNRGFLGIGLMAALFFTGLFASIIISIFYSEHPVIFYWNKVMYLVCSFGVFMVLTSLCFNYIQDANTVQFSTIFTGNASGELQNTVSDDSSPVALKQELSELIRKNKIEEIIEKMIKVYGSEPSKLHTILIIANQLSSLNTTMLRGLMDDKEYQMNRSRIVEKLLLLLEVR